MQSFKLVCIYLYWQKWNIIIYCNDLCYSKEEKKKTSSLEQWPVVKHGHATFSLLFMVIIDTIIIIHSDVFNLPHSASQTVLFRPHLPWLWVEQRVIGQCWKWTWLIMWDRCYNKINLVTCTACLSNFSGIVLSFFLQVQTNCYRIWIQFVLGSVLLGNESTHSGEPNYFDDMWTSQIAKHEIWVNQVYVFTVSPSSGSVSNTVSYEHFSNVPISDHSSKVLQWFKELVCICLTTGLNCSI